MIALELQPLPLALLPAAVELDRQVLGGFWSATAYQQELDRISSDLFGIWPCCPQSQYPSLLGVGCGWTILDEVHIVLLAVHPQYRHQGLGYGMLLGLLESARHRGVNYATLEVRASNQPAITLYTKLGFAIAGQRPNYYSDTGENALVLWRSGLQSPEMALDIQTHWQTIVHRWPQWKWHGQGSSSEFSQPPKKTSGTE